VLALGQLTPVAVHQQAEAPGPEEERPGDLHRDNHPDYWSHVVVEAAQLSPNSNFSTIPDTTPIANRSQDIFRVM
jgi:hypothetical protein